MKKVPAFKSDAEAEAFLDQDLSAYLTPENLAPFPFEYRPKDKAVYLRLSEELLRAIKSKAARHGIPYQRYMRLVMERDVRESAEG